MRSSESSAVGACIEGRNSNTEIDMEGGDDEKQENFTHKLRALASRREKQDGYTPQSLQKS